MNHIAPVSEARRASSGLDVGMCSAQTDPAMERRRTSGRVGLISRAAREPLAHFLIIGLVLVLAMQAWRSAHDDHRIEVTPARIAELSRKYELQYGVRPGPETLERLVEDDIKDEILFREGKAMGLDRDDEIVRRRVIQKQQFLMQGLAPPAEPFDAELRAFYAAHADRYVAQSRATFSHVFFAAPQGGAPEADAATRERAKAALGHITPGVTRAPDLGDPFPDIYDFAAFESEPAQRLFGKTPLADAIFAVPVGHWSGPFRSAYGWHLLYVSARTGAERRPFASVRGQVRDDYLREAAEAANARAFDRLAGRFTVIRNDKAAAP